MKLLAAMHHSVAHGHDGLTQAVLLQNIQQFAHGMVVGGVFFEIKNVFVTLGFGGHQRIGTAQLFCQDIQVTLACDAVEDGGFHRGAATVQYQN